MIEAREITHDQYGCLFNRHALTPYDTTGFNLLNRLRADGGVRFLEFDNDKGEPLCGIIAGVRDRVLMCPYSAPFASPTWLATPTLALATAVAGALVRYAHQQNAGVNLFMPPSLYGSADTRAKWQMALRAAGLTEAYADINYHFDTSLLPVDRNLEALMGHHARAYIRRARRRGLACSVCDDPARAYDIIRRNREERGYPLRMSFSQVQHTISECVKADWFIVGSEQAGDCAAALVYRLTDDTAQVIYWGDIPGLSGGEHSMLVLAEGVFAHYAASGVRYVDIGPASEEGIANAGLCNFKEIIGCTATLKPRYVLD